MSTEPITGLTYQEPGSLQTDALQNAELNYYGAWLNCAVLTIGDAAPPGSPANGDCYIVGTGTGAWATHDDELAVYRDGWQFYAPKEGVAVKDLDSGDDYEFVSAAWSVKGGGGGSVSSVNGATGAVVLTISGLASVQTVTSAGTVTPVATNDKVVVSAQAAAILFDNPSGTEAEGQGFVIALKDNGTARAITWGANYRAMGAALPTTTTISKWTYIPVIYNGTDDKWDVLAVSQEA